MSVTIFRQTFELADDVGEVAGLGEHHQLPVASALYAVHAMLWSNVARIRADAREMLKFMSHEVEPEHAVFRRVYLEVTGIEVQDRGRRVIRLPEQSESTRSSRCWEEYLATYYGRGFGKTINSYRSSSDQKASDHSYSFGVSVTQ